MTEWQKRGEESIKTLGTVMADPKKDLLPQQDLIFIEDLRYKLVTYGANAQVSNRQIARLREIQDRLFALCNR